MKLVAISVISAAIFGVLAFGSKEFKSPSIANCEVLGCNYYPQDDVTKLIACNPDGSRSSVIFNGDNGCENWQEQYIEELSSPNNPCCFKESKLDEEQSQEPVGLGFPRRRLSEFGTFPCKDIGILWIDNNYNDKRDSCLARDDREQADGHSLNPEEYNLFWFEDGWMKALSFYCVTWCHLENDKFITAVDGKFYSLVMDAGLGDGFEIQPHERNLKIQPHEQGGDPFHFKSQDDEWSKLCFGDCCLEWDSDLHTGTAGVYIVKDGIPFWEGDKAANGREAKVDCGGNGDKIKFEKY